MNDTKVVTYRCVDFDCDGGGYMEPQDPPYDDSLYVTHADHRALEERHSADVQGLTYALDTLHAENDELREELASLRARVGELVEADREFDASWDEDHDDNSFVDGEEAHERHMAAIDRRRLAMEATK